MIVEAQALVELDADTEGGPRGGRGAAAPGRGERAPMLRVRPTGAQARAFAKRAPRRRQRRAATVSAVQPPARSGRTRMSAPGTDTAASLDGSGRRGRARTPPNCPARGELTVRGRIREASNAALFCTVALDGLGRPPACTNPWPASAPVGLPDGTLAGPRGGRLRGLRGHRLGARAAHRAERRAVRRGRMPAWIDVHAEAGAARPGRRRGAGAGLAGRSGSPLRSARGRTGAAGARRRRAAAPARRPGRGDQQRRPRRAAGLLPGLADGRLYGIDHGDVTFQRRQRSCALLWGWARNPDPGGRRRPQGAAGRPRRGRLGPAAGRTDHGRRDRRTATRARVDALFASGVHPEPKASGPPASRGRPWRAHPAPRHKSAVSPSGPPSLRAASGAGWRLMVRTSGPLPRSPPCLVRAAT